MSFNQQASTELQSPDRRSLSVSTSILAGCRLQSQLLTLLVRVVVVVTPIQRSVIRVLRLRSRRYTSVIVMMLGTGTLGSLVAENAEGQVGKGDGAEDQQDGEQL